MIEQLGCDGKRIFDYKLSKDKRSLILTEACDLYFDVELTKEQVIELANDLIDIANTMAIIKNGD